MDIDSAKKFVMHIAEYISKLESTFIWVKVRYRHLCPFQAFTALYRIEIGIVERFGYDNRFPHPQISLKPLGRH